MNTDAALQRYLLQLGDNALILGHRLAEWCGHAPEMEIDMALTNMALDLTGQARALYQRLAELEGKGRTEDDIAYLRDAREFYNCLLVEQPNGDFAHSMARQFFFDAYNYALHKNLTQSSDEWLAGFATKALKEITYHLRFSSEWVLRLGDGTETSREKMQKAVDDLWMWRHEPNILSEAEEVLAKTGVIPHPDAIKAESEQKVADILTKATLTIPTDDWAQKGGKTGLHTEYLGYILAEMQFLQRAYPGLEW